MMMWVVPVRQRRDATVWPGRRLLGALDAVAWPLCVVIAFMWINTPTALFGGAAIATALLLGMTRLHRAVFANARYRFTTWAFAKLMLLLVVTGYAIKAGMMLSP